MKITASDRQALTRLASTLPKGSDERRAILAGLKQATSYWDPTEALEAQKGADRRRVEEGHAEALDNVLSSMMRGDLDGSAMNKFEKEAQRRPLDALWAIATFAFGGWGEGLSQAGFAANAIAQEVRAGNLSRKILSPGGENKLHGESRMLFELLNDVFPD